MALTFTNRVACTQTHKLGLEKVLQEYFINVYCIPPHVHLLFRANPGSDLNLFSVSVPLNLLTP